MPEVKALVCRVSTDKLLRGNFEDVVIKKNTDQKVQKALLVRKLLSKDMAKRFTKPTVNWVELEKRVPPEQKVSFFAFKGKADGYLRRVQANPPEAPKIEWEQYNKMVPIPGLVDKLKTEYGKFKVPYPEDNMSVKVDEQWKALEPEIKKFCAEMQKDIEAATKELSRVRALPKFEDMTLEMYADMFPDQALNPLQRPTLWPHTPEEQMDYEPPAPKSSKK